MRDAINRKQKTTNNGTELPNQKKSEFSEKSELTIYGNIGSGQHQTIENERKTLKRVSHENEKTTRNQTILLKRHQGHKHVGCLHRKTLGTILEEGEGRIF